MQIGVISDTHGFLDERVKSYFSGVDEIWHAGDIGSERLIRDLQSFKPLVAVYGNADEALIRKICKENEIREINGVKILLTHIAGPFEKYTPRVKELIKHHQPQVLICGHSHICKVAFDNKYKLLYVNPGAAGNHGFHSVKTILRFCIEDSKLCKMEVIELGKRGCLA